MRGQKQGTCGECGGPIHFYPVLDADGEPELDDASEIRGAWVHLRLSDWFDTPHKPTEATEEPAP
jgi:hypothetical protein